MARQFRLVYTMPPVEFPEIDAFLDAYGELCIKHGMQFEFEGGSYDESGRINVIPCGGEIESEFFNPSEYNLELPFVEGKKKELYADRERLDKAAHAAHIAKLEAELPADPLLALSTLRDCMKKSMHSCDQDALRILIDKALDKLSAEKA